ncbi:MAG: 2-C-methyl-D-erythritol 2,4-cyclodiphosphate synthase, partial [Tissierellales bacterium]
ASIDLHRKQNGKWKVESKFSLDSIRALSLAYTPGVAAVSEAIASNKEEAYNLTMKGTSVAVVSDGSAVLGLGDIGKHFPDTDDQYKDISSLILLNRVYELMKNKNYTIGNIDAIVVAQRPKLAPYIDAMEEKIAGVLKISKEKVNIKATTTEMLGFEGRGEGISAYSTCLIVPCEE